MALTVKIISPQKEHFNSEAISVHLKTDLGELDILENHATLVGTMKFSKIYVNHKTSTSIYLLQQGAVSINNENSVTIQGLDIHEESELKIENIDQYLRHLADLLADPTKYNKYQIEFLEEQRDALQEALQDKKTEQ